MGQLLDILMEISNNETKPKNDEPEIELLTAEKLSHLYDMSIYQLEAIYKHGKRRKVKIADDPEAYRWLKNMSIYQLEAIFGDD